MKKIADNRKENNLCLRRMVRICVKRRGSFWVSEKTVVVFFFFVISVFLKFSPMIMYHKYDRRKIITVFSSRQTWNQVEMTHVRSPVHCSACIHIVPFPLFTEIKGNNIGMETDSDTFRNRRKLKGIH